MKYLLIIERPNGHHQISTEDGGEMWYDLTEKVLKDIVENWFYKIAKDEANDKTKT